MNLYQNAFTVFTITTLAGCGWTAQSNYFECDYEAEKLTATFTQQHDRRARIRDLLYACMAARGFYHEYNENVPEPSRWHRRWMVSTHAEPKPTKKVVIEWDDLKK